MINYSKRNYKVPKSLGFRVGILFLFILMLGNTTLQAQTTVIKGVVTDATTKETLPGVNVLVEGTTIGMVTDLNGKFQITVPSPNSVLVVSYVGYITEKVSLAGKSTVEISLNADVKALDEVVVIGYGSVAKKDLTGTVSSINSKAIQNIPVASAAEALTGKIAGVQITTTDGSPDAEVLIRVRGGGSVTGDNSPLYIVDGFPMNSISSISTSDIQTIDILKDASSAAIYGSRGANGVILITTKSSKGGKTTVSYDNFFQIKNFREMDVLSPYEYVMFNYEYAALRGATSSDMTSFTKRFGVYDDLGLYKYQKGTDQQKQMFGNHAISYKHTLSITGGSEKTSFKFSANYNKDNGLQKNNDYSKLNLNFKLNHEISKSLKLELNAKVSNTTVFGSGTSGGTYKVRTYEALTKGPLKGYDDFTSVDFDSMTEEEQIQYAKDHMSISEQADQYWKEKKTKYYNLTGAITWDILKGLTFRSEFGYDIGFGSFKNYWGPQTSVSSNEGQNLPLVDWTKETAQTIRVANYLTYKFNLASIHNFSVMGGQEMYSYSDEYNYMKAKYFSTSMSAEKIFANIASSSGTNNFSSSSYEAPDYRLASFFGRFDYNLKSRYLLSLVARADGSTKFPAKNRWGIFPAASVAWRISDEGFMKNFDFISNLKWRVSYGVAGNDKIGNTLYMLTYKISNASSNSTGKPYGIGEIVNPYYMTTNTQLANPDLKWETNYTRNTGIDFGFFKERINGSIDAFWYSTKDLLISSKIVAPGYDTQQQNIGKTSTKGIELTLNGVILQHKDYSLRASFNIAFPRTNVDKLSEGVYEQTYNSGWASTDMKGMDDYRVMVGHPVGLIYGFVTDGYYTTDDFDAAQSVGGKYVLKEGVPTTTLLGGATGVRPGTLKLKDLNGDGAVTLDDRAIIGNTNPKHYGGFTLDGTFKGFDLSIHFNWVYGNDIYNATKLASTQNYRTNYPNLLNMMNSGSRYTYLDANGAVVNDLATLKEMNEVGSNKKTYWSPHSIGSATIIPHSWAIEDGSFLRLQNISLGYTLPSRLTQKVGISTFRVFGTLYNIKVWTKYTGYDPEVSTSARNSSYNQMTPGVDFSSYPKSFSYTFGLQVTF